MYSCNSLPNTQLSIDYLYIFYIGYMDIFIAIASIIFGLVLLTFG